MFDIKSRNVQDLRINNKYGSVTALKQWPNQIYMSEKAGLQIKSNASLVRKFKYVSYINFIGQFILLSNWIFDSKRQFETSEAMRILNILHVISK
jgi:hypothetical protein